MNIIKSLFVFLIIVFFCISCSSKNETVWRFSINDTQWRNDFRRNIQNTAPIITGDTVVVSYYRNEDISNNTITYGGVHILNKKTGERIRQFDKAVSPVICNDNTLHFITENFTTSVDRISRKKTALSAYTLDTGDEIRTIQKEKLDALIAVNNTLIFKSDNGLLFCTDQASGQILWKKKYPIDPLFPAEYDEKNDYVYFPAIDRVLIINPSTGELIKALPFTLVGYITVADDVVVVQDTGANDACKLVGISMENHEILWETPINTWFHLLPRPLIFNDRYFIITTKYMYSLDYTTGKIIWQKDNAQNEKKEYDNYIPFQVIDNKLYRASHNNTIISHYNPATGEVVKKIKLNHEIHAPFVYEDSILYYKSHDMVYAEKVQL